MARIRSIHPDACKSEKLDACSSDAERFYWRLQPHCDDAGRAEDDPRILRSLTFPVREHLPSSTVDEWLQELHDVGLIVRYEVTGRRFLQVTRWDTYQKPQKRTESKLPPIPDEYATATGELPEGSGRSAEDDVLGEGEGGSARKRASRPSKDFAPNETHRAYATEHGLNLEDELAGWLDYCEAKGTTYKDHDAGLRTWLRKAVEFGRGAKPAATNGHKPDPPRVPLEPIVRCAKCGFLVCQCKGKARMPAELADRVGVKREVS